MVRAAPEGLIDPVLKTVGFWNEDQPLAVAHYYAVHPTSLDGTGVVNPEFVGPGAQPAHRRGRRAAPLLHRLRRQRGRRQVQRVIGPALGIPGSSCLSSTPSGLSLLSCSELPPSTSAGSLMRALPSSFRTSSGHRVGEGNAGHSEYPATNSTLGGISAISPFALATALLIACLLGWSGVSRPLLSTFTSGLSAVRVAPVNCRI